RAAPRRVREHGAPVRFAAVGQGPLEADVIAEHARSGVGDGFNLLGYRRDTLDVLAAADLFVLSSRQEGLPGALMEALALGLPVVATGVGGIAETVTGGVEGRLVPAEKPAELADAILDLVRDPVQRSRMAQTALRRSRQFDVERVVRSYERCYRRLVSR